MASSASSSPHATAASFRRLVWQGSVPVSIRLAQDTPPVQSGGVDAYFIQAPRQSYLPLLLQDIRENLVELALDDQALAATRQQDWWFEDEAGSGITRWHWPIGLLYDHSIINDPSRSPTIGTTPSSPTAPLRLILHLSNPPAEKLLLSNSIDACRLAFMSAIKEADFVRWGNVKRVTGLRKLDQDSLWDGLRANDFDLHAKVASRILPLPNFSPNSSDHGSSQPPSTHLLAPTSRQHLSRPPSTEPDSTSSGGNSSLASPNGKPDSANAVRSVPIKIHLPEAAGVLQGVVPPSEPNGTPTTIHSYLHSSIPLLFPNPPSSLTPSTLSTPSPSLDPSSSLFVPPYTHPGSHTQPSTSTSTSAYTLAYPIIQGIVPPPETEIAWLGACLVGADGWLAICIGMNA
ncbi:Protein involved in autophagy and nutrient starvation [Phaffia rhodozyma]|uniref:Autophagy protein 5 n=1 Tax=Phaffia rhodozyma TaxID=264483 RepID=A0A0F7SMM9_PHARH|nr:Protein involved in autophagy and nutrient starvation [Phaffia rhodozyma]